jgi:hypothetical protein
MTTGDEMREELLAILAAAARRLLAARSAEAAAAGAIGVGLAAAGLQAAWTVARVQPALAVGMCLLPVAMAACLAAWPRLRCVLGLPSAVGWAVTAILAASGAAGAACVAAGAATAIPKVLLPLALMPVGALAAAAVAAVGGVSRLQAAVYLDVRLGLQERLSTAAELADSPQADGPAARCVFAQAVAAARHARPERQSVWRRTRATAGALGLAAAMCAAVALLPTLGTVDVEGAMERVEAAAADLSPKQREDLTQTLRRLAEEVKNNPKLAAALRAAVLAAEKNLPEQLQEELRRAQDALSAERDAEAARTTLALLRALGLPAGGGGDQAAAGGKGTGAEQPAAPATRAVDANDITARGGATPPVARVFVYDKSYEKFAGSATKPAGAIPAGAGQFVPLRDAWSSARDRAASALTAGSVPAEYRPIVRRFFELD